MKNEDPERMTVVFNDLSRIDRTKLRAAVLVKAMSEIVREDIRHAPWKFPIIMSVGTVLFHMPVPGSNAVFLATMAGWYRLGLTERARWARGHLKDHMDRAAMVERHVDFITSNDNKPGTFRVDGMGIARHVKQAAWENVRESKRIFTSAIRRNTPK